MSASSPIQRTDSSVVGLRQSDLHHLVSISNNTRLYHACVKAAQVQAPSPRRIHELHCIDSEPCGELTAHGVRRRRDLDDCGADLQSCSRWEVRRTLIQIDEELIARKRPLGPAWS